MNITVLFGGAGREEILHALISSGIGVPRVLAPRVASARLEESLTRIEGWGLSIERVTRGALEAALPPDPEALLLSIGFPYLLPSALLRGFSACLNVHPSLLPRYRGPTSAAYVIINGEAEGGTTVHLMDAEMDNGDIVAQAKIRLSRFDTTRSMQRKVYALEPALVLEALERMRAPDFAPTPQARDAATRYPKRRTPADSEIDPRRPLLELYDEIRAADPEDFPAHFYLEGHKVCVKLWRPERPEEDGGDMI